MGIPITIVTGFLGAGKTTLINQVLQTTTFSKEEILIIENELGAIGIDHELLLHSTEHIFQLNNGCLCCSLRTDLVTTFQAIKKGFLNEGLPLRQVIIETTGIADPQPIVQTLLTSPVINRDFYLDSLYAVVDAANNESLEKHAEAKKQVAFADEIILSKGTSNLKEMGNLKNKIKTINPLATIHEFDTKEKINARHFFDQRLFQRFVESKKEIKTCDTHESPLHVDGFHSLYLKKDQAIEESRFQVWLNWLLMNNREQIYRIKGFIQFKQRELLVAVQCVNHQVSFQLTNISVTEKQTELILIGRKLSVQAIESSFQLL